MKIEATYNRFQPVLSETVIIHVRKMLGKSMDPVSGQLITPIQVSCAMTEKCLKVEGNV